jgi:2-polyprenyl-3-methyl-5-hydroxy-6-metoxy-1,4-benzoquinol methylase
MPSFAQRSYEKELLDRDDIPFDDIRQNMHELDVINRTLGGHAITLKGLRALERLAAPEEVLHVVEIGCGGGDNLRAIMQWARLRNRKVQLSGVDINAECIAYAQSKKENREIEFICSDYRNVHFSQAPHVVFSSLFCHHFTNEELVYMLQWMWRHSSRGFFINDLHRHPMAFHSIRILTRLFSKSYLVKNDAPLSVRRGFTRKEWWKLLGDAGIRNASCRWMWAFRWLVIAKK